MNFNKIFIFAIMSFFVISISGQYVLGYGGPPESTNTNNFTVMINLDKESHTLGESIIFSGTVNNYDESRNLRISIFDSSNNLVVTQTTPVNPDDSFSHKIILNEKFLEGKYIVKAQYGNSKSTVEQISFVINPIVLDKIESSTSEKIPDWIKSNAGWWASGEIDDNSFVQGIQFLIKDGLIKIPTTEQGTSQNNKIPDWIKSNAGWWASGKIDDNSFVQGIQFLIKDGLIKISN